MSSDTNSHLKYRYMPPVRTASANKNRLLNYTNKSPVMRRPLISPPLSYIETPPSQTGLATDNTSCDRSISEPPKTRARSADYTDSYATTEPKNDPPVRELSFPHELKLVYPQQKSNGMIKASDDKNIYTDNNIDDRKKIKHQGLCLPVPKFVNTMIQPSEPLGKEVKDKEDVYIEAAKLIQLEMDSTRSTNEEYARVKSWKPGMRRLLDIAEGDVGLALFIPFNWEAFEPIQADSTCNSSSNHSLDESSDDDGVVVETDDEIENCPPILTYAQMHEIYSKGLPATVQLMTWRRCYSLQRDGDCFGTMFKKSSNYQHTLIVIKTTNGEILGGYADTPWKAQKSSSVGKSMTFFGGGRTFLYATNPAVQRSNSEDNGISLYPWTGENGYSQICNLDSGTLGMGGGGAFGFIVQDNFMRGSSGACKTFNNPPLTSNHGGSFEIVDFEVYGFISMSQKMFDGSSRTSSFASVNSSVNNSIKSTKSLSSLMTK